LWGDPGFGCHPREKEVIRRGEGRRGSRCEAAIQLVGGKTGSSKDAGETGGRKERLVPIGSKNLYLNDGRTGVCYHPLRRIVRKG